MKPVEFKYVDDNAGLVEACARCEDSPVIGIDTEFHRVNTYIPVPCLVQIQAGDDCFLVDPLAIDDLTPLARVCEQTDVIKVLHSASEDLEIFHHMLGLMPEPLFDTQIAASMLGEKLSPSYQELVLNLLDIDVPKGETRSDWQQRPLTDSQCQYAAMDVSYLMPLYDHQVEELRSRGRLGWVIEDCARLIATQRARQQPDEYYRRVKTAWKLDRRRLMVLKTLCIWRESRALKIDKPRNWVVEERALVSLAREGVDNKRDLHEVVGMSARQVRNFGDELLDLAAEARLVPESQCPEPIQGPPQGGSAALAKVLRRVVGETAVHLGVAPEVLAKKRNIEELLGATGRSPTLPLALDGWREEVIGSRLMQMVRDHRGQG